MLAGVGLYEGIRPKGVLPTSWPSSAFGAISSERGQDQRAAADPAGRVAWWGKVGGQLSELTIIEDVREYQAAAHAVKRCRAEAVELTLTPSSSSRKWVRRIRRSFQGWVGRGNVSTRSRPIGQGGEEEEALAASPQRGRGRLPLRCAAEDFNAEVDPTTAGARHAEAVYRPLTCQETREKISSLVI